MSKFTGYFLNFGYIHKLPSIVYLPHDPKKQIHSNKETEWYQKIIKHDKTFIVMMQLISGHHRKKIVLSHLHCKNKGTNLRLKYTTGK